MASLTAGNRRPVRLADIAKAAGVSHGTASNVFSRPEIVREEVRERVKAAAEAMGYGGPDPKGRLLRAGKVNAIGVATAEPLSYFFDDPFARVMMAEHLAGLRRNGRRHLAGLGRQQRTACLEHPERAGRRLHRLLHRRRFAPGGTGTRAQTALRGARSRLPRMGRSRRSASTMSPAPPGGAPSHRSWTSPLCRAGAALCRRQDGPCFARAGSHRDLCGNARPPHRLFPGAFAGRHRHIQSARSTKPPTMRPARRRASRPSSRAAEPPDGDPGDVGQNGPGGARMAERAQAERPQ